MQNPGNNYTERKVFLNLTRATYCFLIAIFLWETNLQQAYGLEGVNCDNQQERPKSLKKDLLEAQEFFTYKGVLIHPALIKEFQRGVLYEYLSTVSVDVGAAYRNTHYCHLRELVSKSNSGYLSADILGKDLEYFAYKHHGKMNDNIHVLQLNYSGGGTGIFQYLLFVKFNIDKGYTPDGESCERLLMTAIRMYPLGDRIDPCIKILPDKVIVGTCKYSKQKITAILTFK